MSFGLLLRSRSWLFFTDKHAKHLPWKRMGEVHSINVNGHPFYYRSGLSDIGIIDNILLKQNEYIVPENFQPRIIFDIGANIGAASVYLSRKYPDVEVYAFEPVPDNFELLKKTWRHTTR